MYEARVIGTDIKAQSKDMLVAYCVVQMFNDNNGRISIKFVPNK